MILLLEAHKKPLVSIITVSLNSEHTIEKTIQSVKDQTYDNIEYFIIDGESQDRTLEIVQKNIECVDKVISEKDDGLYDAMNKGISLANGELIGILNSDDWYEKDAVERVLTAWIEQEKPDIVHGDILLHIGGQNAPKRLKPRTGIKGKVTTPFNHPACFVTRALYDSIGYYDLTYRIASDYDFMLRAMQSKCKIYYLEKIITNMRGNGLSSNASSLLRVRERSQAIVKNKLCLSWVIVIYVRFILARIAKGILGDTINFPMKDQQ